MRLAQVNIGDTLYHPADRGSSPGSGVVRYISRLVHTNITGIRYVWINLGPAGVWPSHRLGVELDKEPIDATK